jgi:uncharacterized membrane protein (UPF0127 family)
MTNRKGYIYFSNSCVEIEIAETSEEITTGLMNRVSLPEDCGMLFIFDEKRTYQIWMKNMLISLDVIWLDDKGTIVHIDKNLVPCDRYCQYFGPESYAKFALEVNGGYSDRHNINVGDNVRMIL